MASEIWTAVEVDDEMVTFTVIDGASERTEKRYKDALPLMFALGGYPPVIGVTMAMQPAGWRFRKNGDNIYLDGPSVGVDNYHPIDQ